MEKKTSESQLRAIKAYREKIKKKQKLTNQNGMRDTLYQTTQRQAILQN